MQFIKIFRKTLIGGLSMSGGVFLLGGLLSNYVDPETKKQWIREDLAAINWHLESDYELLQRQHHQLQLQYKYLIADYERLENDYENLTAIR